MKYIFNSIYKRHNIQTNSQQIGHTRKEFVAKEDLLDNQTHHALRTHQMLLMNPYVFYVLDEVYNRHHNVRNNNMKLIYPKVYVIIEYNAASRNHTYNTKN